MIRLTRRSNWRSIKIPYFPSERRSRKSVVCWSNIAISSNNNIVDGNFLKILKTYSNAVESFLHVMEDLGLFTVMKQCVDVVYQGKERPEPKAPRPTPQLQVPTTAATGNNNKNRNDGGGDGNFGNNGNKSVDKNGNYNGRKGRGNGPIDSENNGRGGSDNKDKKKKKDTSSSSSPSSKNKKKDGKGKSGTEITKGNTGDDDINNQTRAAGKSRPKSAAAARSNTAVDEENSDEEEESSSSEEEDPPSDEGSGDEGEESEFLFYFDPKTNGIGMINREECGATSQLLIDVSKEGDDAYQNVIEDKGERQDIIFLLKKLEKKKPVETSWLDEIKKEKAAAAATKKKKKGRAAGPKKDGDGKKKKKTTSSSSPKSKSTERISKRNMGLKSQGTTNSKPNSKKDRGFGNPLGKGSSSSSSSSSSKQKKSTVEDYQGTYKKAAAKPDSGGWKKM